MPERTFSPPIFGLALSKCLIILLAALVLCLTVAIPFSRSQEILNHDLPGLNAFLDKRYPGVRQNRTPLHIYSVDLDDPGDGIDEVLIGFSGVLFCGPSGCLLSIARREIDGSLVEIARHLTHEIEFRNGFVSGSALLAKDIRQNPVAWEIAEKTSAYQREAEQ